jgi:hypothetical protein
MTSQDMLSVGALDLACVLSGAMMYRSWRRRHTRPPLVAGALMLILAALATGLVLVGVPRGTIVGPTFILALAVILYTGRYERREATTPADKPKS